MKKKNRSQISISIQILIFLVVIAFVPFAATVMLETYENQQLEMVESSNVQQGRIVAAALGGDMDVDGSKAVALLERMNKNFDARIRVLDKNGILLADSSALNSTPVENISSEENTPSEYRNDVSKEDESNQNFIYRLLSLPIRFYRKFLKAPVARGMAQADFYHGKNKFDGEEVLAALQGKYGAETRISSGGQVSVTLYSAIPIFSTEQEVCGAVLVSRSTYRILKNLYDLRLDLGKIFLWSMLVAIVVAVFFNFRISYPLKKLSDESLECADRKGTVVKTKFTGSKRHDEIGTLSRSFTTLIEKLNKRQQFADAFSRDISHEFKNPLAAIRSCIEVLESGSLSEAEQTEMVAAVKEEVSHLEILLNGLRNISKVESGKTEAGEKVPLNLCIQNRIALFEKRFPQVKYTFVPCESEVQLGFGEEVLSVVVDNLIDNASGFGKQVLVTTRVLGDRAKSKNHSAEMVCIQVEDDGPGINEEELEKVFARFYSHRAEPENKSHSGLGLSIVKAALENAEGSISVSRGESLGGACFTVLLPK